MSQEPEIQWNEMKSKAPKERNYLLNVFNFDKKIMYTDLIMFL